MKKRRDENLGAGAGAIGGYPAVKLARAGHDVSVVARGANPDAIKRNGLQLIVGAETWQRDRPRAQLFAARHGRSVANPCRPSGPQAVDPAGLRIDPADGDRRDHRSAAGLCPCCRVGDADARYAGGDRDQARTRSRALSVWLDGPARSVNAVAKPASARSRWRVSRASNSRHRCPRPKRSRLPFLPRRRSPQRSPTPTARWYRSRSP